MKRKFIILFILLASLLMNGCGNKVTDMEPSVDGKDFEEAGYSYTTNLALLFVDDGFYYLNSRRQLMFFDEKTNQVVHVCSKPNCKHEFQNNECDANIHGDDFPMVYRNGRIYYCSPFDRDGYQDVVLFSVKPDGSDRKEERKLFQVAYNSDSYNVALYKNYAIMRLSRGSGGQRVEVVDTETGERSVLFDTHEKFAEVYGPFTYYDEVYYGEIQCDKEGNEIKEKVYRYNLKTQKKEKIYEGKIGARTFSRKYMIFSDGKAINRIPLGGGKVEKLFDYEDPCVIGYDGKYLYLEHEHDYAAEVGNMKAKCDDHWVKVMKLDGTVVDTIKWNNRGFCAFGDQRYLFFERASEDGFSDSKVVMKKSDIGGKHHFIDLEKGEPCKNE